MKLRSLASREHRPLIGVTTSEVRPKERVNPVPEGEPLGKEMALGTHLPEGDRRSGRAAGGDAADGRGRDRAAARPARRDLPLRRPRPRPGALRSRAAPGAGADRARSSTASSSPSPPAPTPARCRSWRSAAAPRRSTSSAAARSTSTSPTSRPRSPTARPIASTEPSHAVEVEPGSQLAEAIGGTEVDLDDVNSFHHQAIDRLGDGLRISARAPDGTVEAIEDPSRRFLIGVQWHAETLVHREAEAELFRRFVDACRDDGAEYERVAKREVA